MKFAIPGFIIGLIINLFLYSKVPGAEIRARWADTIPGLTKQEPAASAGAAIAPFVVRKDPGIYLVDNRGIVVGRAKHDGFLAEANRAGTYYITYQKVGKQIEFFNMSGQPFWRLASREYPYLSYNARLIFLLNGDHSKLRIVDHNGNTVGAREISGRLCTVIAFSQGSDFGAAGFADGAYYAVDPAGLITARGMTPGNTVVKSLAVSDGGQYLAVHYGDDQADGLGLVEIAENQRRDIALGFHGARTALHVNDRGEAMILDGNRLALVDRRARVRYSRDIPPAKTGQSSIVFNNGYYAIAYAGERGDAVLLIVRDDGQVVFSRNYPNEAYLVAEFRGDSLLAKGADNLYCYSLHVPALR
jgi:hypothetical protein